MLSVSLPLDLTIPRIHEDIYWKRCYLHRWPTLLPKNSPGDNMHPENTSSSLTYTSKLDIKFEKKTWKHHYVEMHLQDFFENLAPEEYDIDKVLHLRVFVHCMKNTIILLVLNNLQ